MKPTKKQGSQSPSTVAVGHVDLLVTDLPHAVEYLVQLGMLTFIMITSSPCWNFVVVRIWYWKFIEMAQRSSENKRHHLILWWTISKWLPQIVQNEELILQE